MYVSGPKSLRNEFYALGEKKKQFHKKKYVFDFLGWIIYITYAKYNFFKYNYTSLNPCLKKK